MKTVLAYGDSLTWGHDPEREGLRHARADRWPSVLQAGLGEDVLVVPEGLNGRTTSLDDWSAPCDRNGARSLPVVLGTQMPLDLVVVMLGTNDLKPRFGASAHTAYQGMRRLVQIVRSFPYKPVEAVPKVLIVAPPPCGPSDNGHDSDRRVPESQRFAALYAQLAGEEGTGFFDAGTVARPSRVDGVHLDAENTRAIGAGLVSPVRELLG
ncbi:SGNH/GDSL hydrolase family protein [Salipiger mucosus]|uniref:Arylesterase n=1 Tax=Salipiger mucosus DSM 16094 TaxID=1123237 RepID=S9Q601_9RHOB|nr:SGNH/GDSL hydrolase family protein [Salipiger mucosus]EPX75472.1 Arylesterase [Salipiger mucosus DSM 16094]